MIGIVAVVVGGTLLIVGILVGVSIHRESMRRERRHLEDERRALEDDERRFDRRRGAVPGF